MRNKSQNNIQIQNEKKTKKENKEANFLEQCTKHTLLTSAWTVKLCDARGAGRKETITATYWPCPAWLCSGDDWQFALCPLDFPYGTVSDVRMKEWGGEFIFCEGTSHSAGQMVLFSLERGFLVSLSLCAKLKEFWLLLKLWIKELWLQMHIQRTW